MEFGFSLPDKLLPAAWKADRRAVQKFQTELTVLKAEADSTKTELDKLKKPVKRVAVNLTQRRQFKTEMQQDNLKAAIEWAKDPERPRRDMLYGMYDEVWDSDGHTIGETRKAILKVVGSPFGVFKKGGTEIDEQATRLLQKKWFEDYRSRFQEAQFWGHSLVQFVEMVESKEPGMKFEFKNIELIPREHVRPEEGFIVFDTSHETGLNFRDPAIKKTLKLIEMGSPKFLGLLRVATKEYIWKNYARSDWSRHSEKFGMPIVAIKAATRDTKELDKLEQMAAEFGENLWMILDPDDEVDLKEPVFKDSYQIYKELAMFGNTEISKSISGATGTSDEKAFVGGAEVHERVLNDFTEANKRQETYHVNEDLFPFLIEHGYPFEDREYRYLSYQEANPEANDPEATDPNQKGAGGSPAKKTKPGQNRALYKYKI